uniref:VWFD domain-containing protein n=1 Tax=Macrostomum lignano TaxID=282301 RepID=A0A1I8HS53_9PLAT
MNYSYPGSFEDQSFFSTYQDCVIRRMQTDYKSTCGCLGTHCHCPVTCLTARVCAIGCQRRCYHRVLRRHKTQGVSDKHCPVRCTNVRYRDHTTVTSWPTDVNLASEIVRGYVKDNLDQISGTDLLKDRLQHMYDNPNYTFNEVQSLSVLDLYPMSVKTSVFTESFAYPLRNLFSDLGGI